MPIIEVIKYAGSPDVLAWKYPNTDLGTWTQLIVNESQEVVFFKGGQALDVFQSGRHVLSTKNIPLISKIINLPFAGRSPFAAEVWYINKRYTLDIKWGTPTAIQLQDPKFGVMLPVRTFGQFGIRVAESKKFLVKLIGTCSVFDSETLTNHFKGLYISQVKDIVASYIVSKQIGVLEINAHINDLSSYISDKIAPVLNEYGIELVNFYIKGISVPDDDPSVIQLKDTLAKRAEMDIVGYSYEQERSFDTMEGAVTNMGSGEGGRSLTSDMVGATMGMGMGAAIGGNMATQFGGILGQLNTSSPVSQTSTNSIQTKACASCKSIIDTSKRFCAECGADTTLNSDDIICSGCEARNPKDKKFCAECGTSLLKECPQCKVAINGKPKFCPDCGEKMSWGDTA